MYVEIDTDFKTVDWSQASYLILRLKIDFKNKIFTGFCIISKIPMRLSTVLLCSKDFVDTVVCELSSSTITD